MGKIAFIVTPFLGHIYPTLGVGAELLLRGHEVTWLCLHKDIAQLIPEGGKYIALPAFNSDLLPDISFGLGSLKRLYEEILVPLAKQMYHEMKPHVAAGDYDVIVTDQQGFAGALLAQEFEIPFATSVTAPAAIERSLHFPEVMNFEHHHIVAFQNSLGFNYPKPLVCSSLLTIIYSTTEFLDNDSFPTSYAFVGPSIQGRTETALQMEFLENADPSKQIVLVTLGSLLKADVDFVNKVIDAFSNAPFTILLVSDPSWRSEWPENFIVQSYIPQLKVLEKVQAVICHSGYNTVCETLNFGLPLITIPIVNDQSYIATKVKDCGAGIRLKKHRLTSKQLRESLEKILSDESYSLQAKKIQESFTKAGGSKRAAVLIEDFFYKAHNPVQAEAKFQIISSEN